LIRVDGGGGGGGGRGEFEFWKGAHEPPTIHALLLLVIEISFFLALM